MEAVILAGGMGTRLRPLTLTRPKPMLPVANEALIARIVRRLPQRVTRVVIAVNYRKDALEAFFAAHDFGREVILVDESEPLGTGGALKNVESFLSDRFLVLNADLVSSLDLDAMIEYHERSKAAATIALWQVRDPRPFGIVALRDQDSVGHEAGRIVRFVEKPETREEAPSNLANAGAYVLEKSSLDLLESGDRCSIERDLFPPMIARGDLLNGFSFDGYWVDAGTPETYLKANEISLKEGGEMTRLAPGVSDNGASVVDWASVGESCVLGTGAEVERSVLFPRVSVGRDAAIRNSVLGEGVTVEDEACVVDAVIGDGATIRAGVLVKNVKVEPGLVIGDTHG